MSKRAVVFVSGSGDDRDQLVARSVEAYLARKGFTVVRTLFKPDGESAIKNPDALSHMSDINSVDAIGVYDLTHLRWAMGSMSALLKYFAQVSAQGVQLLTVREELDTNDSGGKFAAIVAANFDQARRLIRRDRIHHGMRRAKAAGTPIGRPKKSDDDMIRALRAQGHSFQRISEELGISIGAIQYSLRDAAHRKV